MPDPHKLQVKIGDSEFFAEGTEETVRAQFQLFLKALEKESSTPKKRDQEKPNEKNRQPSGDGPLDKGIMSRTFRVDDGAVSLRALPRTDQRDADALVVILYGYREIEDQHDVSSSDLMAAARESGLQLTRIDNTIRIHSNLVTEGGYRRGKRYGLNNQGINHAESVIRGMFG